MCLGCVQGRERKREREKEGERERGRVCCGGMVVVCVLCVLCGVCVCLLSLYLLDEFFAQMYLPADLLMQPRECFDPRILPYACHRILEC